MEDTVTLDRLNAMYTYWEDFPPVHKLVAAYVGHKPKSPEAQDKGDWNDLMGLLVEKPGGGTG